MRRPGHDWLVLGRKAKGTSVPMLAMLRDDVSAERLRDDTELAVAWETPIPGVDPLRVKSHRADVALSETAAFSVYEVDDARPRLTAISLSDGERPWDAEIDREAPVSGVAYGSARVLVALWGTLVVHDAATGRELYRIGL